MIKAIREYVFHRRFKRLKPGNPSREEQSINTLSSVTILGKRPYHEKDDLRVAVEYFRQNDIFCKGFLFDPDSKKPDTDGMVDLISKEEFQWHGKPKETLLIKWLSDKTDLLICLNPDHSSRIRYLCASSNSRLKSAVDYGFKRDNFVDFYLQLGQASSRNVKDLCQSVYEELKNISSGQWINSL